MNRTKVVLAFLAGLLVIASAALATPGIGVLAAPVHARGTHAERINIHHKAGVKLQTKRPVDFATQQLVIAPGGTTGWHRHPGPVLVTIKSGSLTIVYADERTCGGRTYTAGQSFVDPGDRVHTARNLGATNVEFWATYIVPGAPGTPFRIDEPAPGTCPF